jgi:hypothetical protein
MVGWAVRFLPLSFPHRDLVSKPVVISAEDFEVVGLDASSMWAFSGWAVGQTVTPVVDLLPFGEGTTKVTFGHQTVDLVESSGDLHMDVAAGSGDPCGDEQAFVVALGCSEGSFKDSFDGVGPAHTPILPQTTNPLMGV